jgi:hypothetical protein
VRVWVWRKVGDEWIDGTTNLILVLGKSILVTAPVVAFMLDDAFLFLHICSCFVFEVLLRGQGKR